jgi:toxin ParE1/3/4
VQHHVVAERRFFVRPAAETEIAGAIAWYRSKHPGLEVAFVEEIDRVFAEIREAPERWPLWRQDRPYRQRRLRRFPFVVLYRVTDAHVRVAAVAHAARRPGYWLAR